MLSLSSSSGAEPAATYLRTSTSGKAVEIGSITWSRSRRLRISRSSLPAVGSTSELRSATSGDHAWAAVRPTPRPAGLGEGELGGSPTVGPIDADDDPHPAQRSTSPLTNDDQGAARPRGGGGAGRTRDGPVQPPESAVPDHHDGRMLRLAEQNLGSALGDAGGLDVKGPPEGPDVARGVFGVATRQCERGHGRGSGPGDTQAVLERIRVVGRHQAKWRLRARGVLDGPRDRGKGLGRAIDADHDGTNEQVRGDGHRRSCPMAACPRTTATGQCECRSTSALTDPRRAPRTLPRPRLPTTTRSAW